MIHVFEKHNLKQMVSKKSFKIYEIYFNSKAWVGRGEESERMSKTRNSTNQLYLDIDGDVVIELMAENDYHKYVICDGSLFNTITLS